MLCVSLLLASMTSQAARCGLNTIQTNRLALKTFCLLQELEKTGPFKVKAVKPFMIEIDVDSTKFAPHESGTIASMRACSYCGGSWKSRAAVHVCCRATISQLLCYTAKCGVELLVVQGKLLKRNCGAGGLVTQVKEPKEGKHMPLKECLTKPGEFLLSDFSKIERPQLLHVAFQALEKFRGKENRLPRPGSKSDIEAFQTLCKEVNSSLVSFCRSILVCICCIGWQRA